MGKKGNIIKAVCKSAGARRRGRAPSGGDRRQPPASARIALSRMVGAGTRSPGGGKDATRGGKDAARGRDKSIRQRRSPAAARIRPHRALPDGRGRDKPARGGGRCHPARKKPARGGEDAARGGRSSPGARKITEMKNSRSAGGGGRWPGMPRDAPRCPEALWRTGPFAAAGLLRRKRLSARALLCASASLRKCFSARMLRPAF